MTQNPVGSGARSHHGWVEYCGQRYRAYPDAAIEQRLRGAAGACRFVWNAALEQRLAALDRYRQLGSPRGFHFPSYSSQCAELKAARNDADGVDWLTDSAAMQVVQQVLRDLDNAWGRWLFGPAGRPRFKRRGGHESFRDPQHVYAQRTSRRYGIVKIQGVGEIKLRWHRGLDGEIKHATVTREPDGKWFVSLCVERRSRLVAPNSKPPVGVDLGVVVPVATSDGELLGADFSSLTLKEAERLRRLERQRERCARGSANRAKTQLKINVLKARQRRRRTNFVEQVSTGLVKNHGLVAFEALSASRMTRRARGSVDEPGTNVRQKAGLNRVILDRSWATLVTRTTEKAPRFGSAVVQVPAAYSSQECPVCHTVDAASPVSRSLFLCTSCGHSGHADVKAAITILERALGMGLVHADTGGTPVTASRGYDRGRRTRKRATAESSGKPARGSRNKESGQGRDSSRNRAEASPLRAR